MGFLDEVESSFDPFEYGKWSRIELVSRIISERKELKSQRGPIVDDYDYADDYDYDEHGDDDDVEDEDDEYEYDDDEYDDDDDEGEDDDDDFVVDDDDDLVVVDDDDDDDDEGEGEGELEYPPLTVDDCVLDCPPSPDFGCRRTYRISSTGCRINLGAPFGLTYIFVQGKDSACITTRKGLNSEQEGHNYFFDLKRILMCLADPRLISVDFPLSEKHGDLKQFAVVSVHLSPDEINQEMESNKVLPSIGMKEVINILKDPVRASSHEQSAVSMLQSKLAKEAYFTFAETIQTAISALQCLYGGEYVKADEIRVYAFHDEKKDFFGKGGD